MEREIKTTSKYAAKFKTLPIVKRHKIEAKIDFILRHYDKENQLRSVLSQPSKVPLMHGLESSLYVMKVDDTTRVILTLEEDSLFKKVEVKLFDVTDKAHEAVEYSKRVKSLYRNHEFYMPIKVNAAT